MSDLARFLTARLDEDEAAARDAYYEGQRWITEEEGVYRYPVYSDPVNPGYADEELVQMADRKRDARHIARHDPARVLRDVAAKRKILDAYKEAAEHPFDLPEGVHDGRDPWERERDAAVLAEMEYIVRALASAWSDHPGYDPAWGGDA